MPCVLSRVISPVGLTRSTSFFLFDASLIQPVH
jgi:hypothetical protein